MYKCVQHILLNANFFDKPYLHPCQCCWCWWFLCKWIQMQWHNVHCTMQVQVPMPRCKWMFESRCKMQEPRHKRIVWAEMQRELGEDEAAAKEQVVQELPSLIIILLLSSSSSSWCWIHTCRWCRGQISGMNCWSNDADDLLIRVLMLMLMQTFLQTTYSSLDKRRNFGENCPKFLTILIASTFVLHCIESCCSRT